MGFFDIVTKPEPTMKAELPKTDLNVALKTYAIYGAVLGFLLGLGIALAASLFGSLGTLLADQGSPFAFFFGLGLAAIIVMPILGAILTVLGGAIGYAILWFIAKLLGGTGTFAQNYYLASRLLWPVFVITIIASILQIIPILGQIIYFVWILYTIYLTVVVLSVANSISKLKAFFVWLIPMIVLFLLLFAILGSAVLAMSQAGFG